MLEQVRQRYGITIEDHDMIWKEEYLRWETRSGKAAEAWVVEEVAEAQKKAQKNQNNITERKEDPLPLDRPGLPDLPNQNT